MADAAARREARRRRILENADDRIKRITSSYADDGQDEPNLKPIQTPKSRLTLSNRAASTPLETSLDEELVEDTEADVFQPAFSSTIVQPEDNEKSNVIQYRAFVILLLGICVRYVNLIFAKFEYLIGIDLSGLHISKIFVPLILYEITELVFFGTNIQENPSFNLLLSLNNINPARVSKVLKCLNLLLNVLRDMSIYFFAFIILDLVFSVVSV